MNKKKIINFIIFIPFAIAIGAFILYFKASFDIKNANKVTEIMEVTLVRYRNIGIFSLIIGVILLFIKSLINYFRIDNEIEVRRERVLDKISSRQKEEGIKYSFNENNIINDLLKDQELTAVFYNDKITEKIVKFKNYDKTKNTIEFYDYSKSDAEKKEIVKKEVVTISEPVKKEYVINKENTYDSKQFKKCFRCKKIVAKDSIICVHCGTVLKPNKIEQKSKKSFNPIKFAINMIVILLSIVLVLLLINFITKQSKQNRNYFNIQTIKAVELN